MAILYRGRPVLASIPNYTTLLEQCFTISMTTSRFGLRIRLKYSTPMALLAAYLYHMNLVTDVKFHAASAMCNAVGFMRRIEQPGKGKLQHLSIKASFTGPVPTWLHSRQTTEWGYRLYQWPVWSSHGQITVSYCMPGSQFIWNTGTLAPESH